MCLLVFLLSGCSNLSSEKDVPIIHITQDNYQLLFQQSNINVVVWVDENVIEVEGIQQKLIEFYNNHGKIVFIRETISVNDVIDYLEMERNHMTLQNSPYHFVGILAYNKVGKQLPILTEIYAETLNLKHRALMNASKHADLD